MKERKKKITAPELKAWVRSLARGLKDGEISLEEAFVSAILDAYEKGRSHQWDEDREQINELTTLVVQGVRTSEIRTLELIKIGALKDPPPPKEQ